MRGHWAGHFRGWLVGLGLTVPIVLWQEPRPVEPYVSYGACPFECCHYGDWKAQKQTAVYPHEARGNAQFVLNVGDRVKADTGNVRISRLGRVLVLDTLDSEWAEYFDDPRTGVPSYLPVPAIGDTVFVLDYQGEGWWKYWYKGRTGNGPEFWEPRSRSQPHPRSRFVVKPSSEWWVHIILSPSKSGWS